MTEAPESPKTEVKIKVKAEVEDKDLSSAENKNSELEARLLAVEDAAKAMLAGGLIGVFIAEGSTFAAEEAGCQAECGSASGMAAAALVSLYTAAEFLAWLISGLPRGQLPSGYPRGLHRFGGGSTPWAVRGSGILGLS